MHEVRVYDSSGALKKVISEKTLKARSEQQALFPSGYARGGKKASPQPLPTKKKQAKSA